MARTRGYEVGVGCLLVVAAGVLAFMALQVGALAGLGRGVTITARFADAAGLDEGSAVSVAGVAVGVVERLELDHDAAIVHMKLDGEPQVGKDAKVRIRARSLLGEKYVEVVPGIRGVPAVADGDVLPVIGEQVEIDELVAKLAPLVDGLDPELIQQVMTKLSARLEEDPELVTRMLDNADRMLANGAMASDQLPFIIEDTRATLGIARSTLGSVRARSDESAALISRADLLLGDVEEVTDDLPVIFEKIDATVSDAQLVMGTVEEGRDEIELMLNNFSEFDKWEIRRLLREEGIVVRLRAREVDPEAGPEFRRKGKTK